MFKKIVKRDGKIVDFNLDKITDAIAKAGAATEEFKHDRAAQLSEKVVKLALPIVVWKLLARKRPSLGAPQTNIITKNNIPATPWKLADLFPFVFKFCLIDKIAKKSIETKYFIKVHSLDFFIVCQLQEYFF